MESVNGTGAAGTFAQLNTVGGLTLGGLAFNINPGTTGFDIVTINGVESAYVSSGNALYTLNLTHGVLTSLGTQPGAAFIDIAFVPEPGTYALIGLGSLGLLAHAIRRREAAA